MSKRWLSFSRSARGLALAAALVLGAAVVSFAAAPRAAACPPALCGTPGGPGPSPLPSRLPPPKPPSIIVSSVGDSFASGEGAGGYLPENAGDSSLWRHVSPYAPSALAWLYLETSNRVASGSYPISENSMLTQWVYGDTLYFGASSGATTYDIDLPQVDSDTHLQRNVPQLNYVAPNSNLVYYQFGGNNVGFGHIIATGITAYLVKQMVNAVMQPFQPPGSMPPDWKAYQAAAVQAVINEEAAKIPAMQTQVQATLAEIHAKAPNAAIVLSLYPVAVTSSGNPDIDMMAGGSLDRIYTYAVQLNSALKQAVAQYNAQHLLAPVLVFDPNTAGPGGTSLVAGHEEGTADPYVNGVRFTGEDFAQGNALHAFQQSFHPNREGDIVLGQALATFTQANLPGLYATAPTFYQVVTKPQPPDGALTPAQEFPLLNSLLLSFCGYGPNQSLAGCPSTSGSGGAGGSPAPRPWAARRGTRGPAAYWSRSAAAGATASTPTATAPPPVAARAALGTAAPLARRTSPSATRPAPRTPTSGWATTG